MSRRRPTREIGPKQRFFFSRIFPLPFLLVGVVCIYLGIKELEKANASEDWPAVEGTVLHSSVDIRRGDDSTSYSAEVMYTYEVEGNVHSSNRIGYGSVSSSSPGGAQRIVNSYPVDSRVTVYYDPSNPEESVLRPGRSAATYFFPIFGGVFALSGLSMLIFLPKVFAPKQNEARPQKNPFPPLRKDYGA